MPLDDHDDERDDFRPPLPADDRLWRHPSELAARRSSLVPVPVGSSDPVRSRRRNLAASGTVVIGAAVVVGLVFLATTMRETPTTSRGAARLANAPELVAQKSLARIDTGDHGAVTRSATAIVVRSDGYLLTSMRIIVVGSPLVAALPDGRRLAATVVGTDGLSGLAVLHVDATDLAVTPTGTTDGLTIGAVATAVGATGTAMATGALTEVHAVNLTAPVNGTNALHGLIAIDNATFDTYGGPRIADSAVLVDDHGRITAICMWPLSDADRTGVSPTQISTAAAAPTGYAIPVGQARATADELIANGQATYSWLGVRGGDVDATSDAAPTSGARLTQVQAGGPADQAGLQAGDVITAADGHPLATMAALVAEIQRRAPGASMQLTYRRGSNVATTTVVLDPVPG